MFDVTNEVWEMLRCWKSAANNVQLMVYGCVKAQWVPVRRERWRSLIQFANRLVTVRLSVNITPVDGRRLGRTFINQPYQFIWILDVCLEIEWLPLVINAFYPRGILHLRCNLSCIYTRHLCNGAITGTPIVGWLGSLLSLQRLLILLCVPFKSGLVRWIFSCQLKH